MTTDRRTGREFEYSRTIQGNSFFNLKQQLRAPFLRLLPPETREQIGKLQNRDANGNLNRNIMINEVTASVTVMGTWENGQEIDIQELIYAPDLENLQESLSDLIFRYQFSGVDNIRIRGNPEIEVNYGDPPNPALAGQIGVKIHCLLAGGRFVSEPASDESENKPCDFYTDETKDECFLPVVSLVSGDPDADGVLNMCAGTIVGPRQILTAAHCAYKKPDYIMVGTGVYPFFEGRYNAEEVGGQIVRFLQPTYVKAQGYNGVLIEIDSTTDEKEFLYNPEFCQNMNKDVWQIHQDDIAILTTIGPDFPEHVRATIIPTPSISEVVNIAGFGPDPSSETGSSNIKRYASSQIVGVTDNLIQITSGEAARRDTCASDSGSGVYIRLATGALGAFGVLSNGSRDCTLGESSTYVRITEMERYQFLAKNIPNLEIGYRAQYASNFRSCIGGNCPDND